MSTRSYTAFGLRVESDLALPQLDPAPTPQAGPDVTVRVGDVETPESDGDAADADRRFVDDGEFYASYGVGDTLVRDGREIRVDPTPDAPTDVVRRLVVGPLFNYLLHQRDHLVVHASTVRVGDVAVAFAGESGAGKSTTATAFLAAGERVLSDDVAAVRLDGDTPTVQPGYPAVKLDPDAVEALEPDLDGGPAESVATPRLFHRTAGEWDPEPVPLARVYLLEDGPGPTVEPIPAAERCMALVEHTYTRGAFGLPGTAAENVRRCGSVADRIGVKRLRRPRTFDALDALVETVRADLAADGDDPAGDG